MKKLCLILVIFSLFVFVSCGGSGKENKDETPDSEETVTDDDAVDADSSDSQDTVITDSDEPDLCDPNPCKNIANSDGKCTQPYPDSDYYECGCNKHYFWDGEKCMEWCALEYCKEEYMQGSTGKCYYDDTQDESPYFCDCKEHYLWDSTFQYCTPETKTAKCTGLPENAEWNTVSEITQYWSDGEKDFWPQTQGVYDEEPSDQYCKFKCKENYFWDGKNCIDPCADNPCAAFEHAIEACERKSAFEYLCGCEEGFFWNGKSEGCADHRPSFGNICTDDKTCHIYPDDEYSIYEGVECPAKGETFYGQDVQYANAGTCVRQYFEIGDNTITSLTTGLTWQKEIPETTYTFEAATEYCEQLNLAGKNDWRIPNIHEIMTFFSEEATILTYFQDIYPKVLWTSSEHGSSSNNVLSFQYDFPGEIYYYSKFDPYSVICVSGDELPPLALTEESVNGTNVYVDSATKLMWQKDVSPYKNRRQALEYCENLVNAGYSDWRLPNKNEIRSFIIAAENTSSSINIDGSSWMRYRTSTSFSSVNALNATVNDSDTDNRYYYVRCVRSDICKEGFFWDGANCIEDPCEPSSCSIANSTGLCIPETEEKYECLCNDGYFWNGNACVDPCAPTNSCSTDEHSNGTCIAIDAENYYCGCNSNYKWNGEQCYFSESGISQANLLYNICTAQNKCYDNDAEMICPAEGADFFGQDAQIFHECFDKEFSTMYGGNDTQKIISAKNTGLEWTNMLSEGFYSWKEARDYCETLDYAGRKDWRLPNMQEMRTIDMDNQFFKEVFESVNEATVWTSSTNQADAAAAWTFDPISYKSQKIDSFHVLCVRGKQIDSGHFTISGTDPEQYAVFGSSSKPKWTKVVATGKTWKEALAICENLSYAGISNWHLPDINELFSLVNYEKVKPASDLTWISADTVLWSSTSDYPYSAYMIDFEHGMIDGSYLKTAKKSVICISHQ